MVMKLAEVLSKKSIITCAFTIYYYFCEIEIVYNILYNKIYTRYEIVYHIIFLYFLITIMLKYYVLFGSVFYVYYS